VVPFTIRRNRDTLWRRNLICGIQDRLTALYLCITLYDWHNAHASGQFPVLPVLTTFAPQILSIRFSAPKSPWGYIDARQFPALKWLSIPVNSVPIEELGSLPKVEGLSMCVVGNPAMISQVIAKFPKLHSLAINFQSESGMDPRIPQFRRS
jgi:hypothetical protein